MKKVLIPILFLIHGLLLSQYRTDVKPQGIILKNGPWFDVRAYGAVGDGTTDDYTAIQNCIDAADSFSTVIINENKDNVIGTFIIGTGLRVRKPLTIIGRATLKAHVDIRDTYMLRVENSDITIDGLEFDHYEPSDWDGTSSIINLYQAGDDTTLSRLRLENLRLHDSSNAIWFYGPDSSDGTWSDITIENCHIYNVGQGVYMSVDWDTERMIRRVKVSNCRIECDNRNLAYSRPVMILGCLAILVDHCYMVGGGMSAEFWGTSGDIVGYGEGDSLTATIRNCYMDGPVSYGSHIIDNVFDGNLTPSGRGSQPNFSVLGVETYKWANISGNTFRNPRDGSAWIWVTNGGARITNNVFKGHHADAEHYGAIFGHGKWPKLSTEVGGSEKHLIITENTFDSTFYALGLSGQSVTYPAQYSQNIIFSNNIVRNQARYGVSLFATRNAIISDNIFENCYRDSVGWNRNTYCITLTDTLSNISIDNNNFRNTRVDTGASESVLLISAIGDNIRMTNNSETNMVSATSVGDWYYADSVTYYLEGNTYDGKMDTYPYTLTSDFTLHNYQKFVLCNTSSDTITVSLLPADKYLNTHLIKKIHASYIVIIDPHGGDTIDGVVSDTLTSNNEWIEIQSDQSTKFYIIGQS